MRPRQGWVIPSATVALGASLIVMGSLARGDYAPSVWLDLGAALALFGPLYWVQTILERRIREVRQQEQHTRSSVEQLSHEIEAIRQQTDARLDDLRSVTLEHVQQRRRTDDDAFNRFKEEPTFENITALLDRARGLGAVSDRGVRVRLPGTTFRLRFPLSAWLGNGTPVLEVGLEEEDVEAGGEAHFYSHADMDQFDIPIGADSYVFHPCVIDSVPIRGVGDPVYPFRRG
jgi:heme exporter protein D